MIEDEEDGFMESDEIQGEVLKSFSFNERDASSALKEDISFNTHKPKPNTLEYNRKIKAEANIATPAIDGEPYTIGRYYKLRYSTEIKASRPDVNVYMNSIVDEAIRYYYSLNMETNNI